MKNWRKISLITTVVLIVLIFGIFKLFNLKVAKTSKIDIEFAPKPTPALPVIIDSIKPKNIIVFIADGMGFAHLSLAMLTGHSDQAPSVWNEFEVKGWHDTRSSYGPITDSGASATALATGVPTYFEYIGLDQEGEMVKNVFEIASDNQYATGIVTDSYIWDATPAAFVAHTKSRDNAREILIQMAASELDLIFGELEDLGEDNIPDKQTTLDILSMRFQLLDRSLTLPKLDASSQPIAAIYEEDEVQDMSSEPNLAQLTETALKYLTSSNSPFILLVECEEMDSGSHRNDSERVVRGLESIQETLALLLRFSKSNGETLVVFTADHETGGLAASYESGNYPNMQLIWPSRDHTASVVPLLAQGPGAKHFTQVDRNWQIGKLLKDLIVVK